MKLLVIEGHGLPLLPLLDISLYLDVQGMALILEFATLPLLTRKYLLRGYILGVLTHTTAWDRLWGGDVFLRLFIGSSALPRMTAV